MNTDENIEKIENDVDEIIEGLSKEITYRLHEKGYVGNNEFLHLFLKIKLFRKTCNNADYIWLKNFGDNLDIYLKYFREVMRNNPEKVKKFFRHSEVKQSHDEICLCLDKYLINSTDEEVQKNES